MVAASPGSHVVPLQQTPLQVWVDEHVAKARPDLKARLKKFAKAHADRPALPKGKAKPLESDEGTALREVREETGLVCRLGPPLPSTTYLDADGRNKVVRYWAMTVVPGRAAGHGAQDLLPAPSGQHEPVGASATPGTSSCSMPSRRWSPVQRFAGKRSTTLVKLNHRGTRQIKAPHTTTPSLA